MKAYFENLGSSPTCYSDPALFKSGGYVWYSLAQRRDHIRQLKQGGAYAPVLRALLKMSVIRSDGAHLGLLRYDRATIVEMIESLSMASLMIWRAR